MSTFRKVWINATDNIVVTQDPGPDEVGFEAGYLVLESELPEVAPSGVESGWVDVVPVYSGDPREDAPYFANRARAFIALDAYAQGLPPVTEELINELVRDIIAGSQPDPLPESIARQIAQVLLAEGWALSQKATARTEP